MTAQRESEPQLGTPPVRVKKEGSQGSHPQCGSYLGSLGLRWRWKPITSEAVMRINYNCPHLTYALLQNGCFPTLHHNTKVYSLSEADLIFAGENRFLASGFSIYCLFPSSLPVTVCLKKRGQRFGHPIPELLPTPEYPQHCGEIPKPHLFYKNLRSLSDA